MANDDKFKKVISHAKEYGYVFQSSEIYDGLSAVYDYAQNGAELKKNIRDYWWKAMVQLNENIVGIDASIFMHPRTNCCVVLKLLHFPCWVVSLFRNV